MILRNKLKIEDEETSRITEVCIRMSIASENIAQEIAQRVTYEGDPRIFLEETRRILTSLISETNRRTEMLEVLKKKKLEFLVGCN